MFLVYWFCFVLTELSAPSGPPVRLVIVGEEMQVVPGSRTCYRCRVVGHIAKDCTNPTYRGNFLDLLLFNMVKIIKIVSFTNSRSKWNNFWKKKLTINCCVLKQCTVFFSARQTSCAPYGALCGRHGTAPIRSHGMARHHHPQSAGIWYPL